MIKECSICLIAASSIVPLSCTATETVSKIKCEALGDAIIATNTYEPILKPRLVKFQRLKKLEGQINTRRGERGICTVKNDPPGYKWVKCGKDGYDYITLPDTYGHSRKLFEVEEAVADSVQHRGWSGACKVKL